MVVRGVRVDGLGDAGGERVRDFGSVGLATGVRF